MALSLSLQASSTQRAGRAGRVRPGKCFRLVPQEVFDREVPPVTVPEMQRSDLTAMVLQVRPRAVLVGRFNFQVMK